MRLLDRLVFLAVTELVAIGLIGTTLIVVLHLTRSPQALSQTPLPLGSPSRSSELPRNERGFRLVAVGDVMPGRSVNSQLRRRGDFTAAFTNVAPYLQTADLAFANLEGPLVSDCPITDSGMKFCGDPRFVEGLLSAGIDVVSLANNHTADYGQAGEAETENYLLSAGIRSVNDREPVMTEIRGRLIGWLARNLTSTSEQGREAMLAEMSRQIQEVKEKTDIVVISLHWGVEYQNLPQEWQRAAAHQLVDAGADVILGHHPHVTQPVEAYRNGLILYSMGNFVFDQMWSTATTESFVYQIDLSETGTSLVGQIPVIIRDYFQPVIVEE